MDGNHLSDLRSMVHDRNGGIVLDGGVGFVESRRGIGHVVRVWDVTDFGGLRERVIPSDVSRCLFGVVKGCAGTIGISVDVACH
jgi:hypothetical protein